MNSTSDSAARPNDVVSTHTVRNLLQLVTDFVGRPVWQNELAPERACANAIAAARRVGAVAAAWAPTSAGPGGTVRVKPYLERVVSEALDNGSARTDRVTVDNVTVDNVTVDNVTVDNELLAGTTPAIRLGVLVSELTANAGAHRAPRPSAAVSVRLDRLEDGGVIVIVSNDAALPVTLGPVGPFDEGGLGIAAMIAESWSGGLSFDGGAVTTVTARLPGFPVSPRDHGPAA